MSAMRELQLRLRRALPTRLPPPLQVFIVIGWLLIAGLCVFVGTYAVRPSASWQMPGLYLVAIGASFVMAGSAALSRLLHPAGHRLPAGGALVLVSLLPLALARAGQDRAALVLASGCLLAATVVLALPNTRPAGAFSGASLGRTWVVAVLILLCWFVPSLTTLLDSATRRPWDNMAVAAFIPALGALVLPFYDLSAIAAVTSAGIARPAKALAWLGRYNSVPVILLLLAAKAAYVITRHTVAPELFGDEALWTFSSRPLLSWFHAAALAATICAIAYRSTTRPLANRGWTGAVLLISLVPAFPFLLDILRFMVFVVAFAVSPEAGPELVDRWLISEGWNARPHWLWLKVGVTACVGAVAAWRIRKDAWNAATVLLALGCASMLPQALAPMLRTGAAMPGQVDCLIAIGVVVILVARVFRASQQGAHDASADNRLLVRLLVVPFVVIHAVALVPAIWESKLWPFLAMLAVVISAATLPPVSGDSARHARVLLTLLVLEITGLTTVALVALTNNPYLLSGLGNTTGLSLILLAIPLGGALCCQTRSRSDS